MAESRANDFLRFRRGSSLTIAPGNLLNLVEALVEPLVLALSLWVIALWFEGGLYPEYLILSVIVFAITFPGSARLERDFARTLRDILIFWAVLASLLVLTGYSTHYIDVFNRDALFAWLWFAPLCQLTSHLLLRAAAPLIAAADGTSRPAVIAGMNEQGIALARRLTDSPYGPVRMLGFFDDRSSDRLTKGEANGDVHGDAASESDGEKPDDANGEAFPILGRLGDLAAFIKSNNVHTIYISLPMASQPRILELLDELRDTTASLYFVPDFFITDLIQSRVDVVCGMPVVAVRETPFRGVDGVTKRVSDIVLASIILTLISPLMLALALAVKMSSPGPVIFTQRRYGLDGAEIGVYKFRSMSVCEDGAKGTEVVQAQRGDSRVTSLGAILRRTSLDELPQFFNVLQGRMSIVGPRPHAVAHNELYRGIIKGYMVRHKVRPGITGWAQVNGYRGETDTVDKMKARVDYDLDYLRNWSLRLDLYIILKTAWIVFRKQDNAY